MTQPQDNLVLFLAEILTKQNATTEEKKIQALIKTALYSDNLLQFINEVSNAFNGCGKVKVDTVKGVTEYFKANSEDRIRSSNNSNDYEDIERKIKETTDRITRSEIWILGTLAHLGCLEE